MLHARKSLRSRTRDYSMLGAYFVTVCVAGRRCLLGDVADGVVALSDLGRLVERMWREIPTHVPGVELGEFIVMPNHLHGIVTIVQGEDPEGIVSGVTSGSVAVNVDPRSSVVEGVGYADLRTLPIDRSKMLLPKAIHGFKSSVTREVRRTCPGTDFSWQKSYHDRIIRDERELGEIQRYIAENPARWDADPENVWGGK